MARRAGIGPDVHPPLARARRCAIIVVFEVARVVHREAGRQHAARTHLRTRSADPTRAGARSPLSTRVPESWSTASAQARPPIPRFPSDEAFLDRRPDARRARPPHRNVTVCSACPCHRCRSRLRRRARRPGERQGTPPPSRGARAVSNRAVHSTNLLPTPIGIPVP
jgi:hypothetical protein